MKNLKLNFLWPVALVIAAGILALVFLPGEPTYGGKSLRYWATQLQFAKLMGNAEDKEKATAALRAMGPSAVLHLIRMLQKRDSALKGQLIHAGRDIPFFQDMFTPARSHRLLAVDALGAIGPAAREAIPALTKASEERNSTVVAIKAKAALIRIRQESVMPLAEILSDRRSTNWMRTWSRTASVVGELGTNASPLVPLLVDALLHETNATVRWTAADCLGNLAIKPETVVPALIEGAQDTDSSVRETSLCALFRFHSAAKPAESIILQSLDDSNSMVRMMALLALDTILPVMDTNRAKASLTQLHTDPDPAVRVFADEILGKIGRTPGDSKTR